MVNSANSKKQDVVYLEDLNVGDKYLSDTHALDVAQIKAFAAQFDPQPFHLDDVAAKDSLFGGLAASGWHTASISMKLMVTGKFKPAGGLIGAGVDLNWPTPTRPDDVLHVESEIVEINRSKSRPDRGIVTVRSETRNQHGDVLQKMVGKMLIFARPE